MVKNSVITGTGCYIPKEVRPNQHFIHNTFYTAAGDLIDEPGEKIISKFNSITDIEERRYASEDMTCSTIGTFAAEKAIADAGIDPEELDYIIVAQNFGDVVKHTIQSDMVPSLASRIKQNLKIKNPRCVAYDIMFGCPGWIEATIQAHTFIKAGLAKKCLVIGAETLSRVLDPHDRDSMIFADGAGASILELKEETQKRGIISHATLSYTFEEASYLYLGKSNFPGSDSRIRYIKMKGRKIYEFALNEVPKAMKSCLDEGNIDISHLKKIFIHQANHKMDEAILKRFYRLYKIKEVPENIMPMTIDKLGNSSVATVPTLYDLVLKGELQPHNIQENDEVLFASVGAGMNINAISYKL
ncbi:MAG: ketoacyl-ACP synthase III [Schleiferiaceae bacterium]|jgi:3-oxoacyl-[acyl-carrier-protein] synthase-3|nr:ketoacyl-ACP synthase III [Schleiferiaceae bacterium]